MKILLHYPDWKNRWVPYIQDALREFDVTICNEIHSVEALGEMSFDKDILISMWATEIVNLWAQEFPEKKIVTYIRRFELWEPQFIAKINWEVVDKTIFVSEWCQRAANMMWSQYSVTPPADQRVIPNGIDFNDFTLRSDVPGTKKIGLMCSLKEVKNVPLAFQIMMELPADYTLHHIGIPFKSQATGQIMSYMHGLGLTDRFRTDWYIPKDEVRSWLMDKDYILSTSLNEGNPNCIIEAMAMGIKPIIHNWPGALDQFPSDLVFDRVSGAVDLITGNSYDPRSYRNWVLSRYSLDNFRLFTETIKELI